MISGERRFRRQMSVDCLVPADIRDVLASASGTSRIGIPLALLDKEVLCAFDLTESGNSTPMWTKAQNESVAQAVLYALARQRQVAITPHLATLFEKLVLPEADDQLVAEVLRCLGLPRRGGASHGPEALTEWLVTTLDKCFILTAETPYERAEQRLIFKFSFDQDPEVHTGILGLIGWRPTSVRFPVPSVAVGASYHFEMVAPDGLVVAGAAISPRDHPDDDSTQAGESVVRRTIAHLTGPTRRQITASRYQATIELAPAPNGLALAATAVTLVATAVLGLGVLLAPSLPENADASATLLLTLPGLVATLIARPDEHVLVSRLLRGVRAMTLVSALTLFAAAGTLLTGWSDVTVTRWWFALFGISGVCFVGLLGVCLGVATSYPQRQLGR